MRCIFQQLCSKGPSIHMKEWKSGEVKAFLTLCCEGPISTFLFCRRVLWTSSQPAASSTTWCQEGSTPLGTACGDRPTSYRALTS